MYRFKYVKISIAFAAFLFLSGCNKQELDSVTPTTNNTSYGDINTWLYETMQDAYFWYKDMPGQSTLSTSVDPSDYFEKLIYKRSTVDRFSMVTDDINELENEFNGISKVFGISYSLSYLDNGKVNIAAFINYVVKGSPAEAGGLKRGDIILKINGTQLSATNYVSLLGTTETATFTLGTLTEDTITESSTTAAITKALVSEDPVVYSTVIDKSAYGKKIGYLVYSQFVPGTTADEEQYDNELRTAFANFKAQGINEMVLDLRLNSGGYLSSAETLASLIGKGASSSKVFYSEVWNDKYTTYWKQNYGADALNYKFQNEPNNIGANLDRVFVLTSPNTASASELVINGLRPYMDVVTVGENTAGKNLFGSLIDDDQKRWSWGVYVMLGETANANGESDYGTVNGMTPNYYVEDSQLPYKPFGDENETLLRKALDVIGIPAPGNTKLLPSTKRDRLVKLFLHDNLEIKNNLMIRKDAIKLR